MEEIDAVTECAQKAKLCVNGIQIEFKLDTEADVSLCSCGICTPEKKNLDFERITVDLTR